MKIPPPIIYDLFTCPVLSAQIDTTPKSYPQVVFLEACMYSDRIVEKLGYI